MGQSAVVGLDEFRRHMAGLEDCKGDHTANLKQIGIHGASLDDLLNTMNDVYGIQPHGKTGHRYP